MRDPQTNDDRAAKKSGNTPPIHSPSQGFHNLSLEQGAECSIGLVCNQRPRVNKAYVIFDLFMNKTLSC